MKRGLGYSPRFLYSYSFNSRDGSPSGVRSTPSILHLLLRQRLGNSIEQVKRQRDEVKNKNPKKNGTKDKVFEVERKVCLER